jgi:release factor glutamine methyltransferase
VVKLPSNNLRTIGELLKEGETRLSPSSSSSPRLDSEVLLAHVLGASRSTLLVRLRDVSEESVATRFVSLIERRLRGEPVAYIVGEREFFGLPFVVSPAVLVPRPETELVVEEAAKFLAGRTSIRILDLGTGSGCIAISIVHELLRRGHKDISCDAVDVSPQALQVATQNARSLGVEGHIRFLESDWCANRELLSPPYDCIVTNPPYIDPDEKTPIELSFEPHGALFSKGKGLSDVSRILQEALPLLGPDGRLLCEVGAGKRELLQAVVEPYRTGFDVLFLGDLSEADRFCVVALIKQEARRQ